MAIKSKEIAEARMPQVRLWELENEKLSIFDGIEGRSESVRYPPGYPGVPDLESEIANNMQIEELNNSLG